MLETSSWGSEPPRREAGSPHRRGFPWGLEPAEAEAGQASSSRRLLYSSSPRGPRLAQCAGGPRRSARALQPGSDIHPRSQPGAATAAPASPSSRRCTPGGPGAAGRRGESCFSRSQNEGRACATAGRGASTGIPGREPVGVARRPVGRGSGAPTWWESFETAKVAGHCGGGGRGAGRLAPPSREGRKEKSGGKRGWAWGAGGSDLNRFRPPPLRGKAGAGRHGQPPPAWPGRDSLTTTPPFFFMPTSISTRAHLRRLCGFFSPLGEKTRRVKEERAKRRTPRQALHRVAAGHGDAAATRPLSPGPAACASGRAS